ncbi:uncharacterized protein LOC130667292 [Microplitis mediator]|uniref:uncharacterized protein LOC130667292 n=1 Tax=Microplitis mediator TaxID=375433 RepID=UPI0025547D53|nr:uncharacterized protein LOC130667292 [Microplitis mediator]
MSDRKDSDPYSSDDNREVSDNNKKRRSSIFQPRPSEHHLAVDTLDDESIAEVKDKEVEEISSDDESDLEEYVKSLKAEYNEWKKTLKERKNKRRLLAKQEAAVGDAVELDLNVFTESERAFIQARPNYEQICEKINDLVPLAVKVAQKNVEINRLHDNLVECLEEKIRDSKIKLIEKCKDSDIISLE